MMRRETWLFLHVLVVVQASQQKMKYGAIKKPTAAAAVAGPEARHADQPLDLNITPDVKRFSHQIKRTRFSAHTGHRPPQEGWLHSSISKPASRAVDAIAGRLDAGRL